MASGNRLVALIAKLAKVGGVYMQLVLVVGNGRLVKGMLLVKLYYYDAGTRLNPQSLLNTHNAANITTCLPALLVCVHVY